MPQTVLNRANIDQRSSSELLGNAVHRHDRLSLEGLRERAFTFAFRGLVYPQIWEDPVVDLAALELNDDSRIVAIASGGCNVLSYLTHAPAHITAVDLNGAHIALNRLKLAAVELLPDHEAFFDFFGHADRAENISNYDEHLAAHLDDDSRSYWEGRTLKGRRRIERFANNFYRTGLLGHFIGTGHAIARALGADPTRILAARTLAEQREIFVREIAPLFEHGFIRWLVDRPASLYGLGIPPSQYKVLAGGQAMSDVLRARVQRLACDFPLMENYFAQQAFGRRYSCEPGAALPPYLARENFDALRARVDRVAVRHMSFTDFLVTAPHTSLDRYVLLDAQDWMADRDLTRLWTQITRTARPGARVIFRTAARETLLPGRIPSDLLQRWTYEADRSAELGAKDRSAIYGGFHLYVRRD
jgi:S-adenosylmethionine-diacylglycerol 3-amino-3-carboxypropyl transferase